MNAHRERTEDKGVDPIERLLEQFRPVGAPPDLRERVLAVASLASLERRPRRIAVWLWRAAVAAGLIAAVCLNLVGEGISTRTAEQIGIGPASWTRQEEKIAEELDGEGWGRRYLAMALRAGPLRGSPDVSWAADADKPY